MHPKYMIVIVVLLALALPAAPAHAGGVVTVCAEANLLAALTGGGLVTFTCSGTINLTNTITIAVDTTIDGSGQSVVISGHDSVRVFTVSSGVTLNLNELTVANGSTYPLGYEPGGGVFNEGTLNVSDSTFTNNRVRSGGGGIYNGGNLTVINSNFSGNFGGQASGGIYNAVDGTLTVSYSVFSNNHADVGGGIYNFGTLTVSNSTFSGNGAFLGRRHLQHQRGDRDHQHLFREFSRRNVERRRRRHPQLPHWYGNSEQQHFLR